MISKSSLLTLDFLVWLSVQYTLNTLYLTQKHKNILQKRIEQNCIIINLNFHNFKNVFCPNKSDLISNSSFFSLDFGHKSQSGVLAQTCSVWTLNQSKLVKNRFWWRKTNLFGPTLWTYKFGLVGIKEQLAINFGKYLFGPETPFHWKKVFFMTLRSNF